MARLERFCLEFNKRTYTLVSVLLISLGMFPHCTHTLSSVQVLYIEGCHFDCQYKRK